MFKGTISNGKVVIEDEEAFELYHNTWYGKIEGKKLVLSLIEASFLLERGRIEIFKGKKKLNLKDFFDYCNNKIENFFTKYNVYKDLRNRGLPVREGFEGSDFRVYERGAKPGKEGKLKWIVFADSEDFRCDFEKLEKFVRLVKNIKAVALWAVLDDDLDCTYYIVNEMEA